VALLSFRRFGASVKITPHRLLKRAEVLHRQAGKLFAEHQRLHAELERIFVKLERLRDSLPPVKKDVAP
jgi:hypothetical protein